MGIPFYEINCFEMKLGLINIVLILWFSILGRFQGYSQNSGPVLKADRNIVDLAKVKLKEKRTVLFPFVNNSDNPLVIIDAVTACGCTKVSFDKRPVMPHATDTIRVVFNAKERGAFYKKIEIRSNAPEKITVFSIKGIVE